MKANAMGLELASPVIIASGPWTRGRERMKKALALGAGAIITESIVSEAYPDFTPRYDYSITNGGVENIRLYSGIELEKWIEDLTYIFENNRFGSETKLIASIIGSSPSETVFLAKKIEKTGVDGIELGLACPMGEGPEIVAGDPAKVYAYAKAVVEAVSIPVSVKLSASTGNLPLVVNACAKAGVSGISAIDTIRCILNIDIESGKPGLPTYGGYSGAPIRPIGLSAVAGIAQCTGLPIIGIGGIRSAENAIEYIMAGADAVGIGSEILISGYEVISEISAGMDKWFEEKSFNAIDDIRGSALKHLKSFEEIKKENVRARIDSDCKDGSCRKCMRGCLDEAITFENKIMIDREKCTGCGLCVNKCPQRHIRLDW